MWSLRSQPGDFPKIGLDFVGSVLDVELAEPAWELEFEISSLFIGGKIEFEIRFLLELSFKSSTRFRIIEFFLLTQSIPLKLLILLRAFAIREFNSSSPKAFPFSSSYVNSFSPNA
jgi:hypothetical protein